MWIRRWGSGYGSGCDLPAFAVRFGDEAVGFGQVSDGEGLGIPLQGLFGEAGCDVSECHGFAEGSSVVEAVAGLLTLHRCIDPHVPVAELGLFWERA